MNAELRLNLPARLRSLWDNAEPENLLGYTWEGGESCSVPGECEVSRAFLLFTSRASHIRTSHVTLRTAYRPGIPSAIGNKFSLDHLNLFIERSLEITPRSSKDAKVKDDG